MFWTGIFSAAYVMLYPIPVFFLALDKCLTLKLTPYFYSKYRVRVGAISIYAIILCFIFSVSIDLLQLPLNINQGKKK